MSASRIIYRCVKMKLDICRYRPLKMMIKKQIFKREEQGEVPTTLEVKISGKRTRKEYKQGRATQDNPKQENVKLTCIQMMIRLLGFHLPRKMNRNILQNFIMTTFRNSRFLLVK